MSVSALTAYSECPHDVSFRNQAESEDVLLLLRRHPITYLSSVVIFLLMALAPLILNRFLTGTSLDPTLLPINLRALLGIVWFFFVVGYGLLSFLSWFFNIHLVTNRRIVDLDYFGFMFYRLAETEISQLQDVTYHVGGLLRIIFDFGSVSLQTAAEEREFEFEDIPKPAKVHALIMRLVNNLP